MNQEIEDIIVRSDADYKKRNPHEITQPIIKYELFSPTGEFSDFSVVNQIENWEDLEYMERRRDTASVFKEVSVPTQFVRFAAEVLRILFREHGLYAQVGMRIYLRHYIHNAYALLKTGFLDFETYQDDGTRVTVNISSDEISELINSKGSTKYDIPVSEIKAAKQWNYERMDLLSSINYQIPLTANDEIPYPAAATSYIPLYYSDNEVVPDGTKHEGLDQNYERYDQTRGKQYFFRAAKTGKISFRAGFTLSMYDTVLTTTRYIELQKTNLDDDPDFDNWTPILRTSFINLGTPNTYIASFTSTPTELEINENDVLRLVVRVSGAAPIDPPVFSVVNFSLLNIQWVTKGNPAQKDIIDPKSLSQSLLNKMGEGYTSDIVWRAEPFKTMLTAGESLRGFDEAYVHTSFKDFINWMRIIGYEYEYDGKTVIFRERDYFYNKDITAISLEEKESSKLTISGDRKFAYTGIQIGYRKPDYRNTNGRFEVSTTFDYSTGYMGKRSENTLSLINPYRADSMGIEFLSQEALNKTTDTQSDNDLFFIAVVEGEDVYETFDDKVIVNTDNSLFLNIELFNGSFTPDRLAEYNESLFGIITRQLEFTGTDGNRTGRYKNTQVSLYENKTISKKMHDPILYTFFVGSHKMLPDWNKRNGLIEFIIDNKVYRGFIYEIVKNYGLEEAVKWSLYAVKD